jgi:hypothetical protein
VRASSVDEGGESRIKRFNPLALFGVDVKSCPDLAVYRRYSTSLDDLQSLQSIWPTTGTAEAESNHSAWAEICEAKEIGASREAIATYAYYSIPFTDREWRTTRPNAAIYEAAVGGTVKEPEWKTKARHLALDHRHHHRHHGQ